MKQTATDNLQGTGNREQGTGTPAGPGLLPVTCSLFPAERLARWIAHKMNNPLGAISGNAQLLARRLERDIGDIEALQTYLRYTEAIQSQIERCTEVTDELLESMGPKEPILTNVNIAEAISQAVEVARYGKDSEVRVQKREGVPPRVWTDKDLLVRVLYEVIVNAIQASKNGQVTVNAECGMRNAESVRIEISDTGAGIPEDVLPRIFEPFFSTRERARGIGLTTSLAIMRQLGGNIEVAKTGPEGTTVSVLLPEN